MNSKEFEVHELEESIEESLLSGVSTKGLVVDLDSEAWREGGLNKGTVCTRTQR